MVDPIYDVLAFLSGYYHSFLQNDQHKIY